MLLCRDARTRSNYVDTKIETAEAGELLDDEKLCVFYDTQTQ